MDAFTVFLTVKIIFVLFLENSKKAGDRWDYALVRRKKVQSERAIGSDESDLSEDENGVHAETLRVPCEKIPWEKSALIRVKRSLDDAALERLTPS